MVILRPRSELSRGSNIFPSLTQPLGVALAGLGAHRRAYLERTSVLGFLHRLERGGFHARELEDGGALAVEDSARLELEPVLGIPRGCWISEGQDERRALVIAKLEVDREFDADELTPGAAPAGAVDRSDLGPGYS